MEWGGERLSVATWGTEASEATTGLIINSAMKTSFTTRQRNSPEFCVVGLAGEDIFSRNFHTETTENIS